jgi:hypothetical protein
MMILTIVIIITLIVIISISIIIVIIIVITTTTYVASSRPAAPNLTDRRSPLWMPHQVTRCRIQKAVH